MRFSKTENATLNKAFQLVFRFTLGNTHKHNLADTIQITFTKCFLKVPLPVPDPLAMVSRSFSKPKTLFIVASIVIHIDKMLSNKSVITSIIRKGHGLEKGVASIYSEE